MRNALTVDVEDYFHVSAFDSCVRPADWESMPSRVQGNTLRVLELFEELSVRGTFLCWAGWPNATRGLYGALPMPAMK
ncbi:hypothetical protein RDSD_002935 [Oleidesulfovibrio alaskensis]|uniref:hypothetical protein n=1 Tax=Oleidesulfovibrio alaskensis TaxID=58180 RepID=UPI0000393EF1|nr:hypothetical protein [Oleidesulfovibrio alaskensis]